MEETFAASTALDEQGRLSLSLEREGWTGYPFPLRMEIRLSLNEGFAMEITLENTGTQACPVGHGWHPYFTLGNSVTECDLSVPAGKRLMMGPTAVPTGERSNWPRFKQAERIGDDFLDACLELQASEGTVSTRLTNPHNARSLDVWQDVGAGKYGYLQVFTHPLRHGLALEPMTCAPDAFNNGYGLVVLQPGEKLTTRCGVRAF
jgi:aldose 1-epimerase